MLEMETSINGECAKSDIEEWLVRGSYFTDDYWWQSESINQKASTGKHHIIGHQSFMLTDAVIYLYNVHIYSLLMYRPINTALQWTNGCIQQTMKGVETGVSQNK